MAQLNAWLLKRTPIMALNTDYATPEMTYTYIKYTKRTDLSWLPFQSCTNPAATPPGPSITADGDSHRTPALAAMQVTLSR